MMRLRNLGFALLCASCNSSDRAPALAGAVIDTLPGGIPRVMSSGPTEWKDTNGWKLVLERTVQPPDSSPGAFGDPQVLLLRADGSFVVYDKTIRFYDTTGSFVRTLGREGDGPGEYRSPHLAMIGDTLIMHDPQQTKASLLTIDGTFVRAFPTVCCNFGLQPMIDSTGRFRVTAMRRDAGAFGNQWVRFAAHGERLDSMPIPQRFTPKYWEWQGKGGGHSRATIPLSPANMYGQLRNGDIVVGATDRYDFVVTRSGTDTVRIFGRTAVAALPVPAAVRDSLFTARTEKNEQLRAIAAKADVPSTYPLWSTIHVDGRGNVWIATGGEGQGARSFDVFDPSGKFLGAVPRPFAQAWSTSWAGDHMAVLDHDDNDEPRVRVYRIVRR